MRESKIEGKREENQGRSKSGGDDDSRRAIGEEGRKGGDKGSWGGEKEGEQP